MITEIKRIELHGKSDDSRTEIVILGVELESEDGTTTNLKEAIRTIESQAEDYIRIEYVRRDWSPTGQLYTTGLERISRFVEHGYLHYIYRHKVSIDC